MFRGRKKVVAVNNVSFNAYSGEITALLGHNGAGKTTTINMLVGNLEITEGTGMVVGYNAKTQMRAINQIRFNCFNCWNGLKFHSIFLAFDEFFIFLWKFCSNL